MKARYACYRIAKLKCIGYGLSACVQTDCRRVRQGNGETGLRFQPIGDSGSLVELELSGVVECMRASANYIGDIHSH